MAASYSISPEKENLVVANLGLAATIANDYRNIPGVSLDDLVQVARMALTKAAQAHDPAHGASFAAYAGRSIRNALNSLYGAQTKITQAESISLDAPADDQNRSWYEMLAAELEDDALPLEREETRRWLSEMLDALPDRIGGQAAFFYITAEESKDLESKPLMRKRGRANSSGQGRGE